MEEETTQSALSVAANIGFNSYSGNCMVVHPSDMHFIWATGPIIVIKSINKPQNTYLKGHQATICSIAVSKNGKLLASGENQAPGQPAALIVWSFDTYEMLFRVRYHKEEILALSFSCDSEFLLSLGGQKD